MIGTFLTVAAVTDAAIELSGAGDYLPVVNVQIKITYVPPKKHIRIPSITIARPRLPALPTIGRPTLPTLPILPRLNPFTKRPQAAPAPVIASPYTKILGRMIQRQQEERQARLSNRESATTWLDTPIKTGQNPNPNPKPNFPNRALTRKELARIEAPDMTTDPSKQPTAEEWALSRPAPLQNGADVMYEDLQTRRQSRPKQAARQAAKTRRQDREEGYLPRRNPALQPIRGEYSVGLNQHAQGFRV